MSPQALPDDPDRLKAMLLAERAESERLRQIIKELQRHRFGRRAESLPEEQLQLGLEEAEQIAAAGATENEEKVPAEQKARAARRRANRGALPAHLPRIETVVDIDGMICPAAAARCTGSARMSPSGSISCRHSSGCWSCAGPNTPAGLARTWWCRRPRRHG
jgi:hypothetical protein